ncbi:MAG: hypothetical protein ACM3YO_07180 [Bacteroidota bacterium]
MRPWALALSLLLCTFALPAAAEKLQLMLSVSGDPAFSSELTEKLNGTRRFLLLPKPKGLPLATPLTPARLSALRQATDCRLILLGALQGGAYTLQVMDLALGDLSRPLVLKGDRPTLAQAVTKYLASSYPLSGTVTALQEKPDKSEKTDKLVFFNLGAQNGVLKGSRYEVRRYPETINQPVAKLKVEAVDEWFSTATVEWLAKKETLHIGDPVFEDPADILSR